MTTKAAIGIENEDGTVLGIYCNYDGYLEGVGTILNKHYQDSTTVRKLIEGGNIKYLSDNRWATEYYIRDNKELNNTPQLLSNIEDFERYFYKMPFYYVYSKNSWQCRQGEERLLQYINLSHAIEILRARNGLK